MSDQHARSQAGEPDQETDLTWKVCPDCDGYAFRTESEPKTGLVTLVSCEMCQGEGGWRD